MTVENDGPYKAEDDGGASIYDVWDVYVHQFDLHHPTKTQVHNNTHYRFMYQVFLSCGATYRFFPEKVQRCLNVGPLLEDPMTLLSFLQGQFAIFEDFRRN